MESHRQGDLQNLGISLFKQFDSLLQPQVIDVFHAGHVHMLFEKTHEMVIAEIAKLRQIRHGNILGKMKFNVIQYIYREINVESQEKDPDSVLNYYRQLVKVRKSPEYKEVFTYGKFVSVYEDTDSVMAYYREGDDKRILVAANFGRDAVSLPLDTPMKKVLPSNCHRTEAPQETLTLDSCEVIVLECV